MVAYLVTHVRANLLVFEGPEQINAYSRLLHGTAARCGPRAWCSSSRWCCTSSRRSSSPAAGGRRARWGTRQGASRRSPPRLADHPLGWRADPLFLVYHILHFTLGTVHPLRRGDPYHNVAAGSAIRWSAVLRVAMAAVGLHLYHGIWSSVRSLGVSRAFAASPQRQLALALAVLVWAGSLSFRSRCMRGRW